MNEKQVVQMQRGATLKVFFHNSYRPIIISTIVQSRVELNKSLKAPVFSCKAHVLPSMTDCCFLTDLYLFGDPLNRQTFRGSFVVGSWGQSPEGRDLPLNDTREARLQRALVDLYQNSELRSCFVSGEILALDK